MVSSIGTDLISSLVGTQNSGQPLRCATASLSFSRSSGGLAYGSLPVARSRARSGPGQRAGASLGRSLTAVSQAVRAAMAKVCCISVTLGVAGAPAAVPRTMFLIASNISSAGSVGTLPVGAPSRLGSRVGHLLARTCGCSRGVAVCVLPGVPLFDITGKPKPPGTSTTACTFPVRRSVSSRRCSGKLATQTDE